MENKVTSVTEPNRCEYEVQFTTPAICKEPKKPTEENDLHDEL
jgi:protein kinase C substrate 80K-H